MSILVIAEHAQGTLKSATYNTVTAAQQLPGQIDVLILGEACLAASQAASFLPGIRSVIHVAHPALTHPVAENLTPLITQLAKDYRYILAPATRFGKNLLPRVAALLDIAVIGDVIHINSPDTFTRPIYAGNVLATVQSHDALKALTIRPTAFTAALPTQTPVPIQSPSLALTPSSTQLVEQTLNQSSRPELATADYIVAGGRALGSAENFTQLLGPLADKLNAAIGASRSAVDAGYAPNEYQIGQTGTVVAPLLYFAFGISGAVQHQAGIKDAKVIVAVDLNPDADIFQIADYGLVADIFEVIPELTQAISSQ
jgi:electron transfer flavoprotein alpha subunit